MPEGFFPAPQGVFCREPCRAQQAAVPPCSSYPEARQDRPLSRQISVGIGRACPAWGSQITVPHPSLPHSGDSLMSLVVSPSPTLFLDEVSLISPSLLYCHGDPSWCLLLWRPPGSPLLLGAPALSQQPALGWPCPCPAALWLWGQLCQTPGSELLLLLLSRGCCSSSPPKQAGQVGCSAQMFAPQLLLLIVSHWGLPPALLLLCSCFTPALLLLCSILGC